MSRIVRGVDSRCRYKLTKLYRVIDHSKRPTRKGTCQSKIVRLLARSFKSGPAHGVGDERGGDTKGQPGALHSGQARVGRVLAKGLINGIDKGAHKGAGLPIVIGVSRPSVLYKPLGLDGHFHLTRPRRHCTMGSRELAGWSRAEGWGNALSGTGSVDTATTQRSTP
jgi:hypothetical protein